MVPQASTADGDGGARPRRDQVHKTAEHRTTLLVPVWGALTVLWTEPSGSLRGLPPPPSLVEQGCLRCR